MSSRVLAHEEAGGARVVEVDVREQEMAQVGDRDAVLGEPGAERFERRCGTAVMESRAFGGVEQVRADDALAAEVEEVDEERLRHGRTVRCRSP